MVIIIYVLYLIVSAAILALGNNKREWLLRFVIVAALPLIGWFLPLMWPRKYGKESREQFDDYVTKQQQEHFVRRAGLYSRLEKEKELNVIPIEDALLVSEHQTRRRVMIDVLKQDTAQYMEILQKAVGNEDTETSHYAVSAIMETKRKLLLAMQDLSVQYENNRSDEHIVRTYAEVLKDFMRSGFLDEKTLSNYRYTYLSVLENLISMEHNAEWAFQEKMDTELALDLYAEAESTGNAYLQKFPQSEEAYLCLFKVYYESRSAAKLQSVLERLKSSPLRLSHRALTLVRFWSEGA